MLADIQKSLNSTTCPVCNTGKLIAILRCDLDPDMCISKANCDNCSSNFHLNEKTTDAVDEKQLAVCDVNGMMCTLVKN